MTQYYVIDSRAVEKIWCVIKSNPMYFVTTSCYLSTQKESCSYRYGWLETQKQSEMYHHCDSVCIEVHVMILRLMNEYGRERRLNMYFDIRRKPFIGINVITF